jgi:hypothetical protein
MKKVIKITCNENGAIDNKTDLWDALDKIVGLTSRGLSRDFLQSTFDEVLEGWFPYGNKRD